MPRQRKPDKVEISDEQILNLPVPVVPSHREHEHRVDPWQSLPGAMPDPNPSKPKKQRKDEVEQQIRERGKMRLKRYDRFLDDLAACAGNEVHALAMTYSVSQEEARERYNELMEDVQAGVATSSISDDLHRYHAGKAARARVISRWLYSNNPAASLKAADMANELDSGGPDLGSFEQYARNAASRK
jgi:hypothetical protein